MNTRQRQDAPQHWVRFEASVTVPRPEGAAVNQPRASESASAALGLQQPIVCALKGRRQGGRTTARLYARPFRARRFFVRGPRAALADSLALGWFTSAPSARLTDTSNHTLHHPAKSGGEDAYVECFEPDAGDAQAAARRDDAWQTLCLQSIISRRTKCWTHDARGGKLVWSPGFSRSVAWPAEAGTPNPEPRAEKVHGPDAPLKLEGDADELWSRIIAELINSAKCCPRRIMLPVRGLAAKDVTH